MWIQSEVDLVDALIADTKTKKAHGPLAKALQDSLLKLYEGEKAELERLAGNYLQWTGVLRGDLVDVDQLLGVTSDRSAAAREKAAASTSPAGK
jgi:hypothetical protein